MAWLTVIGMTSEAGQCCSCRGVQSFPHVCLAALALLAGFVGHRVPPLVLITVLTVLSALQVGVSLRGKWADPDEVRRT